MGTDSTMSLTTGWYARFLMGSAVVALTATGCGRPLTYESIGSSETKSSSRVTSYATDGNDVPVAIKVGDNSGKFTLVGRTTGSPYEGTKSGGWDLFWSSHEADGKVREFSGRRQKGSPKDDRLHGCALRGKQLISGWTGAGFGTSNEEASGYFVSAANDPWADDNGEPNARFVDVPSDFELGDSPRLTVRTIEQSKLHYVLLHGASSTVVLGVNDQLESVVSHDLAVAPASAAFSPQGRLFVAGIESTGSGHSLVTQAFDDSGKRQWSKTINDDLVDREPQLAVSQVVLEGGVEIIVGATVRQNGARCTRLYQYRFSGEQVWRHTLCADGGDAVVEEMTAAFDPEHFWLTGTTTGSLGDQSPTGDSDVFAVKFDQRGTWLGRAVVPAEPAVTPTAAIDHPRGGLFVAATADGSLDGVDSGEKTDAVVFHIE